MYCKKCKKEYEGDVVFCKTCGKKLVQQTEKKSRKKLVFGILGGLLAVVVIVAVVVAILFLKRDVQKGDATESETRSEEQSESEESETNAYATESETEAFSEEESVYTESEEVSETETEEVIAEPVIVYETFQDERKWAYEYFMELIFSDLFDYVEENGSDEIYFSLIYIDEDDIPELYLQYPEEAQTCNVLMSSGEHGVAHQFLGTEDSLSYVDHGKYIDVFHGRMGEYQDEIYVLSNGKFEFVDSGRISEMYDESIDDWNFMYSWSEGEYSSDGEYYDSCISQYLPAEERIEIYCYSDVSQKISYQDMMDYLFEEAKGYYEAYQLWEKNLRAMNE